MLVHFSCDTSNDKKVKMLPYCRSLYFIIKNHMLTQVSKEKPV